MNKDNDYPELQAELQHLRDAMSNIATPTHVEQNIMRAFVAQNKAQNSGQQKAQQELRGFWPALAQWFAPSAAIMASVGMVTWLVLVGGVFVGVKNPTDTANETLAQSTSSSPFIALQSLEQIALEPNPRLIETTVPKMLFASMGIAVSPEMASETVRAEMLVSASGQPLALRLSTP